MIDQFFRDYLTYKNGAIPNFGRIYEEFKNYHRDKVNDSLEDFCRDLYMNAKYYSNMYYSKSGDPQLDVIFKDIAELRMEVSFPLLLKVYNDYDNDIISKEEFCEILKCCESYVFRRAVSGIPTNSLNKTYDDYKEC